MISLFKHSKKTNSNVAPEDDSLLCVYRQSYVYIIFNRDSSNDNSIHEYRLISKELINNPILYEVSVWALFLRNM